MKIRFCFRLVIAELPAHYSSSVKTPCQQQHVIAIISREGFHTFHLSSSSCFVLYCFTISSKTCFSPSWFVFNAGTTSLTVLSTRTPLMSRKHLRSPDRGSRVSKTSLFCITNCKRCDITKSGEISQGINSENALSTCDKPGVCSTPGE